MDKVREEFEAYCKRECLGTTSKDGDGDYFNPVIDMLWHCWQASRAALCVKLPKFEDGSLRGYSGDCEEARIVVDCIAESLEEAGISYE